MYKDMFKESNIDAVFLAHAKELALELWSRKSNTDKHVAIIDFCSKVCPMCDLKVPVVFIDRKLPILGVADRKENVIVLKNFSFVTFIHEFRHLMQGNMSVNNFLKDSSLTVNSAMKKISDSMEEDAIGFSVSVFYILFPERYEKAVAEGRLAYK
jgi:hypothetical protein